MAFSGGYCDRFQVLLPLHALGNPLGEDSVGLREHLDTCAACRREEQELHEALALLPYGLQQLEPPAEGLEQLLGQILHGAPMLPRLPLPLHPPRLRRVTTSPHGVPVQAASPKGSRRWGLWALLLLALAAGAGAAALALREHRQLAWLREQQGRQAALLLQGEERVQAQTEELRAAEGMLRLLAAPHLRLVPMLPPDGAEDSAVQGQLLFNPEGRTGLLQAFQVPLQPHREVVVLVQQQGGAGPPRAAGSGQMGEQGTLRLVVQLPPEVNNGLVTVMLAPAGPEAGVAGGGGPGEPAILIGLLGLVAPADDDK